MNGHGKERAMPALGAALALLLALSGCGGPAALTGGSVPVGTSLVNGVVVRADNVSSPVADAPLALTQDGASSSQATSQTGDFSFGTVSPGAYSVSVSPSGGTGLAQSFDWQFQVPPGKHAYLVAAVWPQSFNPSTVASVTVVPQSITLRPGESVRFVATAYDTSGQPIALRPSLLMLDGIGTLAADGTFTASNVGHGELTAWMAGHTAVAHVDVIP